MSGFINVRSAIVAALFLPVVPGGAAASEALARKAGCLACHSIDQKVVGPAFHDVATRYRGTPRARDTLRQKVKDGGKGNWTDVTGGVPMPPHSALLSDAEIRTLVDWVLSR